MGAVCYNAIMHRDHDIFIAAIHGRRRVELQFFSKEDGGILIRSCAPMDYGPSRKYKDQLSRYHLWDYDSDEGPHSLSILPAHIRQIRTTDIEFLPVEFVKWIPRWFISRDWDTFS
jgi:hypothetical protein